MGWIADGIVRAARAVERVKGVAEQARGTGAAAAAAVHLHLQEPTLKPPSASGAPQRSTRYPKGKIVILEDASVNPDALPEHFKEAGYEVISLNREEGWETRLRATNPDFVLIDPFLVHQKVQGEKLVRQVRAACMNQADVVMMSGLYPHEIKQFWNPATPNEPMPMIWTYQPPAGQGEDGSWAEDVRNTSITIAHPNAGIEVLDAYFQKNAASLQRAVARR